MSVGDVEGGATQSQVRLVTTDPVGAGLRRWRDDRELASLRPVEPDGFDRELLAYGCPRVLGEFLIVGLIWVADADVVHVRPGLAVPALQEVAEAS